MYHQKQHRLGCLPKSRHLRFSHSKCRYKNRSCKKERRCSNERPKSKTSLPNKSLNYSNSLMWTRMASRFLQVSLSIKCGVTAETWRVCQSCRALELQKIRINETGVYIDEGGILVWELKSKLRTQEINSDVH